MRPLKHYLLILLALALALLVPAALPAAVLPPWFASAVHGYVAVDCLPVPSGPQAVRIASCTAYVPVPGSPLGMDGLEESRAHTLTFPVGAGTYWLAVMHPSAGTIPGWTRQEGTPYRWSRRNARPALPPASVLLATIRVDGIALPTVYDLRDGRPGTHEIDVTAPIYGARGDGVTNDAAAFTAACAAVRSRGLSSSHQAQLLRIPAGKTYRFTSTWTCTLTLTLADNPEVTILADGATFVLDADTTLLDFSPTTSCTSTAGDWGIPHVRKIWWRGGSFVGPGTAATQSRMLRAYGIRGLHLEGTHATHFHTMADVCVQDNFHVVGNRWGLFAYGIHQPDATVDEVPARQGGQSSTNWQVTRNTFSGGEACHTAIALMGGAMQHVVIQGNSIGGPCAGAWVHIQTGETGQRQNQAITIRENTHEQARSQAYGYRVTQRAGTTAQTLGLTIAGNELRFSGTTGFVAMDLAATNGLVLQGNLFDPQNASQWVGVQLTGVHSLTAGGNHFARSHGAGGVCWRMPAGEEPLTLGAFACGESPVVQFMLP